VRLERRDKVATWPIPGVSIRPDSTEIAEERRKFGRIHDILVIRWWIKYGRGCAKKRDLVPQSEETEMEHPHTQGTASDLCSARATSMIDDIDSSPCTW